MLSKQDLTSASTTKRKPALRSLWIAGHGIVRRTSFAVREAAIGHVAVEDRVKDLCQGLSHDAIGYSGNPQWAGLPGIGSLGDGNPPNGLPSVPTLHQFALDLPEVLVPIVVVGVDRRGTQEHSAAARAGP